MSATTTVHFNKDTIVETRWVWLQTGEQPWQGKNIAVVSMRDGGHELTIHFDDPALMEKFGNEVRRSSGRLGMPTV